MFKLLLEEESLPAWVDRTVASDRLGVEFAPAEDGEALVLRRVSKECDAFARGLRVGDHVQDATGRSSLELLHVLATAAPQSTARVSIAAPSTVGEIDLSPQAAGFTGQALRWVAGFVPQSVEDDKLATLKYLLIALVTIITMGNVFRYIGEVWIARAILRSMMALRTELFERTLQLPMSFFATQPSSDIVGRFVQDIQEVQRGMLTLFSKFIREPLRAVFIIGFALALDWRMTLTIAFVAPVIAVVFWAVGRRVKRSNRKLLQAYGYMIGALTASLQNLRVVKAYTAEDIERDRLRKVDDMVLRQQLKLAKLQAFVSPAMETVAVVVGSFLTLWLASRVLSHELTTTQFATMGVTLSMLFDPLRKLSDVYVRVQRSTAGAERIFHVIDHPIERDDGAANIDLQPLERAIDYVGVSFTYEGATSPALDNVSLSIARGETVALVGPNGCGKTTLVSMLLRFFNPSDGKILYDGDDIRQATLTSLRKQIGLVTQEAIVFAGTPLENIGYGQPSVDSDRAQTAAKQASADSFISALPEGYETQLAERGSTLSGGQRQRLAIARAIFRDAPILIFDEATSQIDTESESRIQEALAEFSKDRTTLIVAHRLSTILFADRIVVMDAGRIIDGGTHAELLGRCELYQNLCKTQFGAAADGGNQP